MPAGRRARRRGGGVGGALPAARPATWRRVHLARRRSERAQRGGQAAAPRGRRLRHDQLRQQPRSRSVPHAAMRERGGQAGRHGATQRAARAGRRGRRGHALGYAGGRAGGRVQVSRER